MSQGRGVPPDVADLEPAFVRDVRQFIHTSGAVALHRLPQLLPGWQFKRADVIRVCRVDGAIDVDGGVALSRLMHSDVDEGARRVLGVGSPQPLPALYTGVLRHLRARKSAAEPTLDEFEAFLDAQPHYRVAGDLVEADCRLTKPSGLDAVLLASIGRSGSGLSLREPLVKFAQRRGYRAASVNNYTSSSVVLDFAATGVVRRRGAAVDLRIAEELRQQAPRGPRWASWGWLGDVRFWIQCRITPRGLSPSPPRDLLALLRGRAFRCLAADRTEIGVLEFDDDGRVSWDLQGDAPVTALITSVLEFQVGRHPAVVVLSGETAELEDEYAGDVDACVLHDGRWWAVLFVDQALLDGGPHLLPHVLLRHVELRVGDERQLTGPDPRDVVVLKREPHAGVLHGLHGSLGRLNVRRGTWIRIAVTPAALLLKVCGNPQPGTVDDLRARVGLSPRDGEQRAFAQVGAALGLPGVADRVAVTKALTKRGRTDLALLSTSARAHRVRPPSGGGLVARSSNGRVLVVEGAGAQMLPVSSTTGVDLLPFGVPWARASEEAAATVDRPWQRWIHAFLRAWLAASTGGPVVVELSRGEWRAEGSPHRRLVDALESAVVEDSSERELPLWSVTGLPSTGLGFVHMVKAAVDRGLTGVTVMPDAVATRWGHTVRTGAGLVDAFLAVDSVA